MSNEDATKQQIEQLLTELTAAQQSYDEWRKTQPDTLEKERSAWPSIRDRQRMYDTESIDAWKAKEPGLASKPEVIAAKRRIAELQVELASEQNKLRELVEAGTPFAQYQAAVGKAENMVGGILQRLRRNRIESVLVSIYGTSNQAKLPKTLTDVAKLHPSVVELDLLRFHPRVSALRESQITQMSGVESKPASDGRIKTSHFFRSNRLEMFWQGVI